MKTHIIQLLAIAAILAAACTHEENLGDIPVPAPGYILPQGQSPDDDRIVDLYERYGSYFLYDYTLRDLLWTHVANSTLAPYVCTPADPAYVGPFLDFLDDVWFKFYPDEFLAEYLPYKVFLADTVKQEIPGWATYYRFSRVGTNQIALSFCSDTITRLAPGTRFAYKTWLQRQLWADVYVDLLEFPDEYFALSNYTRVTNSTPGDPDYYYTRGFFTNMSFLSALTPQRDLYNFFWEVMSVDYAAIQPLLDEFPLLARKYEVLMDGILSRYGVDLRAIIAATYSD
jgi:hypothetical protein